MFPVSDFGFVYCGMATVAATMGYVYAKRRRVEPYSRSLALEDTVSPNDDPVFATEISANSKSESEIHLSNSSEEIETQTITVDGTTTVPAAWSLEPIISIPNPPVARGPSLKRKQMHDHDENNVPLEYPYNLTALYPNKRCKTPPSAQTIEPEIPLPKESTRDRNKETAANPEPTSEILTEPVGDSLKQPASKRQRHGSEELEYSQAQRDDKPPLTATQLHSSTDSQSECTPQVPPTTENDALSFKPSVATLDPTPPTPPRFGSEKFVPKTEKNALAIESHLPSAPSSRAAKATPASQTFAFEGFATATPALFNNETLASGANMRPVWSTANSFRKRHSFVDNPDDVTASSDSGEAHALGLASRRDSPSYTRQYFRRQEKEARLSNR
ncbi:hypothetical protein C8J55DRAFT_519248 [Lentinula edodes]|uniref:Uncharacterized protein n=1 Tax=Lentinula lateritia TaxID=40482 RepID=A0A9W9A4H7_9AGAR|nr:hypothetical protein C8J55DRAFT_519248 [Lentinula edodes]